MSATLPTAAELQRAKLEKRIEAHKREVAQWREEHGDPREALDQWIRANFELEDLLYARSFVRGLSDDGDDAGSR